MPYPERMRPWLPLLTLPWALMLPIATVGDDSKLRMPQIVGIPEDINPSCDPLTGNHIGAYSQGMVGSRTLLSVGESWISKKKFTSVKWTVFGVVPPGGQTLGNKLGRTIGLSEFSKIHPGKDHSIRIWLGGTSKFDTFGVLNWDATPGLHTITADITYNDGTTAKRTAMVRVSRPIVHSFSVTYGPTRWIGTGFASRIVYRAHVTAPSPSGVGKSHIAIIQTRASDNRLVNMSRLGTLREHTMTTPGMVLDNHPSMTYPPLGVYGNTPPDPLLSWAIAAGDDGARLPEGMHDSPTLQIGIDRKEETGCVSVRFKNTYKDYLVYRSGTSGLWVKIAETEEYTLSGAARWEGSFGNGRWVETEAPSPDAPVTIQGTPKLGWVSWERGASPRYINWDPPVDEGQK